MEVFTFAYDGLPWEDLITEPVYQTEVLTKDDKQVTTLPGLQTGPMNGYGNALDCSDALTLKKEEN